MRVAVLLTGFLRTYKQSFYLLQKNVLDKHDVDLYLCTWDRNEDGSIIDKNFNLFYKNYNVKNIIVEDIQEYNKNKIFIKTIDRKNDIFKTNERAKQHGEYWINRLKDQWYLVQKGFLSLDKNTYDIIFRVRYDIFLSNIELKNQKGITLPVDCGGWDFTDHMAYGDKKSMEKYFTIHDHIYILYEKYNVDISHATEMTKFYIKEYKKPVKVYTDNSIKYFIRK